MSDEALKLRESIDTILSKAVNENNVKLLRKINEFAQSSATVVAVKRLASEESSEVPKKKLQFRDKKEKFFPTKNHVESTVNITLDDSQVIAIKAYRKSNESMKQTFLQCPHCDRYATGANRKQNMEKHLTAHFLFKFYPCLCCPLFSSQNSASFYHNHLLCCMPLLTPAQITQYSTIAQKKIFKFADLRSIVEQIYLTGIVDESLLQLDATKFEKIKEVFPAFFIPQNLDEKFSMFFEEAFEDDDDGNRGRIYNFLEVSDEQMTLESYHLAGRYTGSTISKYRTSKHRNGLKWFSNESSKTFYKKKDAAEADGRKFKEVTLFEGVRADYRFSFENAIKRVFELLATEHWNVRGVPRSEGEPTRDWSFEEIVLLGIYLLKKSWPSIEKQF